MKQLVMATAALAILSATSMAYAEEPYSLTANFVYGSLSADDVDVNPVGVNIKYRDKNKSKDPISAILSFTYANGSYDRNYTGSSGYNIDGSGKLSLYSLAGGGAYRINEYVSPYFLAGFTFSQDKFDGSYQSSKYQYSYNKSKHDIFVNFGGGVQINPTPNFVIDLAYEAFPTTALVDQDDSRKFVHLFHVGGGIRFK